MQVRKMLVAAGFAAALATSTASAQSTFSQTLSEFHGPSNVFSFPTPFTWASFGSYSGQQFFSMSLSGTFGNSGSSTTAGADVFFGNILVAQCVQGAACNAGYGGATPWSYTLTAADLMSLNQWVQSNALTATVVQTSPGWLRLGATSIRGTYGPALTPVPEPATVGLMAVGLVGLGIVGFRRRRRQAR